LGWFKREAVGRQGVQVAGQILLGVLDLPGVTPRFRGRFDPPAIALLFDQAAGTVHYTAHRKAVLVSNRNRRQMGNFPQMRA